MKAITLRNLPPDLARTIRLKAKSEGTSINKTVINMLRERMRRGAGAPHKTLHHDLDSLAGSWTKRQAAEFDRQLQAQRTIDHELWK